MRLSPRRALGVLAVAVASLVPAPAMAAGYCSGAGVNVVVDYGAVGGAVDKGCGTGSNAAAVFKAAGVKLTPDMEYPSVVCKVNDLPADAQCARMPPGDAYWGLFWSDGTSGHWVYSTVSVDGLKVPDGGFVAFAWQAGSAQRTPAAAPTNPRPPSTPTASSSPTRQPTTHTSKKPAATATSAAGATSPSPAAASGGPSASVSAPLSATEPPPTATPSSPSATTTPSGAAAVSEPKVSAAVTDSGSGLPWWVPAGAILVLAGAGGAVWRVRRARS